MRSLIFAKPNVITLRGNGMVPNGPLIGSDLIVLRATETCIDDYVPSVPSQSKSMLTGLGCVGLVCGCLPFKSSSTVVHLILLLPFA